MDLNKSSLTDILGLRYSVAYFSFVGLLVLFPHLHHLVYLLIRNLEKNKT